MRRKAAKSLGQFETIRKVMRTLRRECPTHKPIRLRTVPGYRHDGDARERPGYFLITLDRGLSIKFAVWILKHEYAHCLDIERNGDGRECHRRTWGGEYSEVYRAWEKEHAVSED